MIDSRFGAGISRLSPAADSNALKVYATQPNEKTTGVGRYGSPESWPMAC